MKTKIFTFLSSLRVLGIVAGLILFIATAAAATSEDPPVNLLTNPGFESGLTDWVDWGGTHAITTTNVHSGAQALEHTGDGGMAQVLSTGYVIGSTYLLSAWCVLPAGATGSAYIGVQSIDGDGVKTTLATPEITNTTSFEKQEMMFTIPAGTVSVSIFVYQEGGTTSIIVDDFSFTLAPENMLVNPGFENGLTNWGSWGGTQTINTTNVHSGNNSMEFTGEGGCHQTLTSGLTDGATYTLTAWCVIPGGATASAYIGLQSVDAADIKTTLVSPLITNTASFEKYEVSFTLPPNTKTLAAFVYQEGGTTTIISDDFTLTQTGWPVVAKTGTGFNYTPSFINITGGGAMPDTTNGVVLSCDGTGATDVTACIQAALNDAASQGKALLIPYTTEYYMISDKLNVNCSVIGIGGMPTIKQTNELAIGLQLVDNMTGWIYNLHIVGTYDGNAIPLSGKEFAHNIGLGGVNGVTISNNLLETPLGDNIGDQGGNNAVRNVLITNNTLLNPWRCNISAAAVVDRFGIFNNVLTYYSQYVDPIDIEPYHDASLTTNIEIGYNDIQSPLPYRSDGTHFYEAIVQVTAWWDPTPGGNIISHHNWGDWGLQFTQETGYQGGPSTWTNLLDINNAEGTGVPGSDLQPPTVATALTATDITKTSFTLSWEASTDNTGVTGYLVYQDGVLLGFSTSTSFNVSGLGCGKAYSMKVKAYDADGNTSPTTLAYNVATSDCGGGTNQLLNPGFEEPLSVGWTADWGSGNSMLDSTMVRSGKYSLKIEGTDGGRAQEYTAFIPGGMYVLSAYGMLTGIGGHDKQDAYIGAEFKDSDGARIDVAVASITDTVNWQKSSVTFTVPENTAKINIYVYFEARGITTTNVLTDDWSLISVTPVSGVTVSPATVSIAEGIVNKLTATVAPEEATNQTVTWSSSDTTIAKVDSKGLVQGMMAGAATITATTEDGGFTGTCAVTVTTPTENILKNPGIEQALSVGWTDDWGNNQVFSTEFHTGAKCLAVGPSDGGRAQPLTGKLIPNSTYTLSAFGLFQGTGTGNQEGYIGIDIRNAAGTRIATPSVNITDSVEWKQVSVTFTVPADAIGMVAFSYLEAGGIIGNYLLTDDWALISGWKPMQFSGVGLNKTAKSNLKLYPNPLTGQSLNIAGAKGAESVSIFDMSGRMVYTQQLRSADIQKINLGESVSKGAYVVKLTGKTGVDSQLLLVK